jgi:hypothetical protein
MKKWMKWILCLGVLLFCVQASSALTVKELNVPKTDLKPNDNVNLELQISAASFSNDHDIQITSHLTGISCVVTTYDEEFKRDVEVQVIQERTGNMMLYGWVLPPKSSFTLKVTFNGKVPADYTGQNISLIQISELSSGSLVGTPYKLERRLVNPQEIASQITNVRTDLQTFKQTIVSQASSGIDTSQASAKAVEAENALNKADSLKSTSFSQAITQIDTARTAIRDGNNLLEKAGAEYEINQVEQTMAEVESMVSYFTVNRSVSQTDSRLVAITNKYDLASQTISSANDLVSSGNYLNGKAKAAEAAKYANDAYDLSTALKTELGEGIGLPGINPMFLILGLGVIVIGVVGYFAYRKFYHWDELG